MLKKTWECIRNILNVSKKDLSSPSKLTVDDVNIFDPKIISEKFNDFFVNIGNKVEAKIPQPKSSFMTYLKNRVGNSMFITPVDDIEVFNMLKKLIKINLLDLTAFQQTCFKSTLRLLLFPLN